MRCKVGTQGKDDWGQGHSQDQARGLEMERLKWKATRQHRNYTTVLTGKWWEGWGQLAQTIVPTPSSPPWRRCRLLHTGMETGTAVPPAPAPTLRGRTPKLLQPRREAEAQAACLTARLAASTPVGMSVLPRSLLSSLVFQETALIKWGGSSVSLLSQILLSRLQYRFKSSLLPFSPVQVVHTVNLSLSQVLSLHLSSLCACLSVTTSSPGVNYVLTSSTSSLSSLSLCPLLSHRLSPQNTVTLSPSLCLSLSPCIYLLLSLSLSPYLL